MKISKATAEHAIAGTAPANMNEYNDVVDFCAKDGEPFSIGRMGVFVTLGHRLKRCDLTSDLVDISQFKETITPDEAFGALDAQKKERDIVPHALIAARDYRERRPPISGRDAAGNQGERDDPPAIFSDMGLPPPEPITVDFQAIARHAREEPRESDCANRSSDREPECAARGCGFCTAAQRVETRQVHKEIAAQLELPPGREARPEDLKNGRLDTMTPRVASDSDLARRGLLRAPPSGDFYPPHTPGAYPAASYLHVAAWAAHAAVQGERELTLAIQAKASEENAPLDVLFKGEDAWVTCSDMPTALRAELGAIVDKLAGRPMNHGNGRPSASDVD